MGKKTLSISKDGQEIKRISAGSDMITDDDDHGWENLLSDNLTMDLCYGDKTYEISISRSEYNRMVDDGVLKLRRSGQ